MALQWARTSNNSKLLLKISPQIRDEEINPLNINHLLQTCSWAYIAEAVKRPCDYSMVNYEKVIKEKLEEEERMAERKLNFAVVRYLSGGGKKMAKVKDRD